MQLEITKSFKNFQQNDIIEVEVEGVYVDKRWVCDAVYVDGDFICDMGTEFFKEHCKLINS